MSTLRTFSLNRIAWQYYHQTIGCILVRKGKNLFVLIFSIPSLTTGTAHKGFHTLRTLCIEGITANEETCRSYVRNSIGIVTALNPIIGYKNSTKIAKEALETGRSVYDLVIEHGILTQEDLDKVLAPENMIQPVRLDIKPLK